MFSEKKPSNICRYGHFSKKCSSPLTWTIHFNMENPLEELPKYGIICSVKGFSIFSRLPSKNGVTIFGRSCRQLKRTGVSIMKSVSITSHIGRSQHDNKSGKDTRIRNASDLARASRHNNHDYTQDDVDRMESSINLDLKKYNKQYNRYLKRVDHLDLVSTVKEMYHEEFDAAVENYNKKQISKNHSERCINDYFTSISDNEKQEVAVEGIIQIGDMDDWKDSSIEDRLRIEPILFRGLEEVLKIKGFKLAGVSFHVNETSPHLHYVGICVDESIKKTGMAKRIGKAKVFTKEVLSEVLQNNVRKAMEPLVQKEFGLNFKEKETGRNKDLSKNQLINADLENNIKKNTVKLNKTIKKHEELEAECEQLSRDNNDVIRLLNDYFDIQQELNIQEINDFEAFISGLVAMNYFYEDFQKTIDDIKNHHDPEERFYVGRLRYLEDILRQPQEKQYKMEKTVRDTSAKVKRLSKPSTRAALNRLVSDLEKENDDLREFARINGLLEF